MKKELLITVCAATFFAGTAMAEIASGTEGNISWSISDDGELTISGSGDMSAYAKDKINNKDGNGSVAPWYSYNESVKKIYGFDIKAKKMYQITFSMEMHMEGAELASQNTGFITEYESSGS